MNNNSQLLESGLNAGAVAAGSAFGVPPELMTGAMAIQNKMTTGLAKDKGVQKFMGSGLGKAASTLAGPAGWIMQSKIKEEKRQQANRQAQEANRSTMLNQNATYGYNTAVPTLIAYDGIKGVTGPIDIQLHGGELVVDEMGKVITKTKGSKYQKAGKLTLTDNDKGITVIPKKYAKDAQKYVGNPKALIPMIKAMNLDDISKAQQKGNYIDPMMPTTLPTNPTDRKKQNQQGNRLFDTGYSNPTIQAYDGFTKGINDFGISLSQEEINDIGRDSTYGIKRNEWDDFVKQEESKLKDDLTRETRNKLYDDTKGLYKRKGLDFDTDKVNNFMSTASSIAPMLYNLAPKQVEKENRYAVAPARINYADSSNPLRSDVRRSTDNMMMMARNFNNPAAMYQMAKDMYSNQNNQMMRINDSEFQRKLSVQNQNAQGRYQANTQNNQYNLLADENDAKNRAAAQAFTAQGLGQLSGYSQNKQNEKMQMDMMKRIYPEYFTA